MDTSQLLGTLHPSSALDHSDGPTAPGGRQAIHLRLTEDLLQKLLGLGTTHKGELQIDLGSSPAFIVQGESYPISLDPEGAHHQVARRVGGQAPGWQPVAHISHKARIKPTLAALHKAGQGLRGNYQQTEHDRAERRTQVLDSPATAFAPGRTGSPVPSAGADSRSGSKPRAPSRLSAVPPKPTTSFRLGKGTLPPSMSRSRSTSEGEVGSPQAGSPPEEDEPAVASTSAGGGARAVSPTRKGSSSSEGSSSNGGSESHTSKGTARTSLSSVGSPPGVVVTVAAGGAGAKPRGGVIKGKETIKKEAKAAAKAGSTSKPSSTTAQLPAQPKKARITKSPSPPPPTKLKASTSSTSLAKKVSQSSVQSDRDLESDPSGKKRRKLLNGVADEPSRNRKGSASPARAPTPISSPRPVKPTKDGSKKRAKPERWFSSSDDDEDAEGEEDVDLTVRPSEGADKRRRTNSNEPAAKPDLDRGRHSLKVGSHLASASPRIAGSPLRASSTLPPVIDIPLSIIRINSRKEYDNLATQFNDGFKPYAKLHAQLEAERETLENGEDGELDEGDTERLVRRVETMRSRLEGVKAAMADWVMREKDKEKSRVKSES